MRCPGEIDIAKPRWQEKPTLLVSPLLSHIHTLAPGEHREKFRVGIDTAEGATGQLLSRVRQTPEGFLKAKLMARLITVYRNTMDLREYPKHVMMQHFWVYKQAILEESRALVQKGLLPQESDVFYLSLGELKSLAEGTFPDRVADLVEERKKQHQRYEKLSPPRVMTSEGEVVAGNRRNVEAPVGALIGTPVSPGVVEGYARVVMRPEEAQLKPGEIMIAPFTDPGWTPLFNSAKGLVMEVGGLMTHGAVIAREYGIPAVVGIDGATRVIPNGARIRVDGTRGFVQTLDELANLSQ